MTDAVSITSLASVSDKFIEIIAAQSILCSEPQKFGFVLDHTKNGTMRQPFVGVYLFELSILFLRMNAEKSQDQEQQKTEPHYFHTHKLTCVHQSQNYRNGE
jgi:hypothetical protein